MSAGELADHFPVSKPTMSAHFAVLREAGLIASEKQGKSVVYELELSVLEDALVSFAKTFGWEWPRSKNGKYAKSARSNKEDLNP
jgi:DNA-binding transcriptional ArsR family regulator